ncbi:FG-GAP repeat protein [Halosimplex halobium]|uniref:FG-GAP repeat protein n=1 Tax=Halosimplex halobium TaxID=3396618 RepID=UPI003F57156D
MTGERPDEADDARHARRSAAAGGLLGLLGLSAGFTAARATGATGRQAADPTGDVGTADRPLEALYTAELNGPITDAGSGPQAVTSLVGDGLTVDSEALSAAPARPDVDDGATTVANASELALGSGLALTDDGDGTVTVAVDLEYTYRRGETLVESGNSSRSFGTDVALTPDASVAAVGDRNASSDNGGKVFVYDRTGGARTVTTLTESVEQLGYRVDDFGYSVAISDDGRWLLAGSATADAGPTGVGLLYRYDLTAADVGSSSTRIGIDGADGLGRDVAVDADGTTAVAGAPLSKAGSADNVGAASVLDLTADDPLATEQRLTASDATEDDEFGSAVAVTPDGSTAVVGAPGNAELPSGDKAYVFDLSGSPTETARLVPSDGAAGGRDRFGADVAVSDDGETVVVGAPLAPYDGSPGPGKVYVYDLSGSSPTETVLTPTDGEDGDEFGSAVTLAGDRVTVAAPSSETTVPIADERAAVSGSTATGSDEIVAPVGASLDPVAELTATDGDGATDTRSVTLAGTARTTDASLDVDALSVTEINESSADVEFEVSLTVSDADDDLDSVDLRLYEQASDGSEIRRDSISARVGSSPVSTTTSLVHAGADGAGNDYRVEVTVSDSSGNVAVASGVTSDIDATANPRVDELFVWEPVSGPDQRAFEVDWTVADDGGALSTVDVTVRVPAERLSVYDLSASDPTAASAETEVAIPATDGVATGRATDALAVAGGSEVVLAGRPHGDSAYVGHGVFFTRTN